MDKLTMHSTNLADKSFKKLAAFFSNAVTETVDETTSEVVHAIDQDVLMQEINTRVGEGSNGTPGGFDSENLYVEDDNLDVLKLPRETYLGKVKMIYVWSIEHIFPQGSNIPQAWVEMIAGGDRNRAEEYRARYGHTLGNPTITGYNSSLGNRSFEEKRDRKDAGGKYIGYKNGLNLNADVVDKAAWTVDVIKARTDRMVEKILTMFRL